MDIISTATKDPTSTKNNKKYDNPALKNAKGFNS